MYAYKQKIRKKVYVIAMLSVAVAVVSVGSFLIRIPEKEVEPVLKEEAPIVSLGNEKTFIYPFDVEATVVKEYFDGSDHEVSDYTSLEGVYRPNQGIDYAFDNESFEVLNMMDGNVVEVKEDALFGNSITIESDYVKITYQSLDGINFKVGDYVEQKTVLGKAGTNTYNPELGNHLHVVCMVKNVLTNPKNVIEKTLDELK